MITYAADFETFYDDQCSVKILGNHGYFSHPDFEAYMLSVVGDNGYTFCGNPRDFDWSMFNDNIVLSHNAAFDETLHLFGVEKGWWGPCSPKEWACTADMCAYFSMPRALKPASNWLLGIEMEKTVRDNMKGKRWETMTPEFQKEVTEYAIKDSEICLKMWQELGHKWPDQEREISRHTRTMMRRGLPIDESALDTAVQILKQKLFDSESLIPWVGEKKLLSPIAFAEECRKYGVEPPSSMAMDNEECDDWMERFGEQLPFAAAVRNWRRVNSLTKKLSAMQRSLDHGRYYGGMLYCGAHTKRFSGSGGNLNLQNLPKEEMFGVHVRNLITTKPGKKLVVVDLSQIEVRTVVWLSGDKATMEIIRSTPDLYEAFGIAFGLWKAEDGSLREKNPKLRQMLKTIGLGVLYGASASKVATIAGCTEAEAEQMVRIVHRVMKPVTRLWKRLKMLLTNARKDGHLQIDLPSGNSLVYRKVKSGGGRATVADIVKNGRPITVRMWHGSLIENCCAAESEVLVDGRGWVPMATVQAGEFVWDGEEFVPCRGWRSSGTQPVIDVHGVRATPDHPFLFNGVWKSAEKACNLLCGKVSLPHGDSSDTPHWEEIRTLHSDEAAPHSPTGEWQDDRLLGSGVRVRGDFPQTDARLEADAVVLSGVSAAPSDDLRIAADAREVRPQALCSMEINERPVPSPNPSSVGKLWGARDSGLPAVAGRLSKFLGRHVPFVGGRPDIGPNRQQRGLHTRELPLGDLPTTIEKPSQLGRPSVGGGLSEDKRGREINSLLPAVKRNDNGGSVRTEVGDLLNCGPRKRFVIRGGEGSPILIAHNCSQSLARDIFMDRVLEVERAGYPAILHVHDEVVVEVDEEVAEKCLDDIVRIMSTPPSWIPDIALSAEGSILSKYEK